MDQLGWPHLGGGISSRDNSKQRDKQKREREQHGILLRWDAIEGASKRALRRLGVSFKASREPVPYMGVALRLRNNCTEELHLSAAQPAWRRSFSRPS